MPVDLYRFVLYLSLSLHSSHTLQYNASLFLVCHTSNKVTFHCPTYVRTHSVCSLFLSFLSSYCLFAYVVNLSLKCTFGFKSNKRLPVSAGSHFLCHFTNYDSFAPLFVSAIAVNCACSSIFSAWAASFANLSAISPPSMFACPGVHSVLTYFLSLSSCI